MYWDIFLQHVKEIVLSYCTVHILHDLLYSQFSPFVLWCRDTLIDAKGWYVRKGRERLCKYCIQVKFSVGNEKRVRRSTVVVECKVSQFEEERRRLQSFTNLLLLLL